MTYGNTHGLTDYTSSADTNVERGSGEFFRSIDQTFYSWNVPLHSPDAPFARLFPYQRYRDRSVLEIGCGMGTMSMNWALHGARVTAVDLNPVSIEQTQLRFNFFGLPGTILQADANDLPLPDSAFDYAYSWGVLHHSPNLELSLQEMFRVLRPGGEFALMLYGRRSLLYWYSIKLIEGFLHGENLFLDELGLASRSTDASYQEGNFYTWPVVDREVHQMLHPLAENVAIRRLGTELDWQLQTIMPFPKLASWFPKGWRKAIARRWGWSLWITGNKKATPA